MEFDFEDSSKIYDGVHTIVLTAALPYNKGSETITFYLDNIRTCLLTGNYYDTTTNTANHLTMTSTNQVYYV